MIVAAVVDVQPRAPPAPSTQPQLGAGASALRKALREPLVHFVVLGTLLFAVHAAVTRSGNEERRIVLSPSLRAELESEFTRKTGRSPTPQDSRKIVADWASEEVLYSEGLRLGLDRRDLVVRNRVVSKMRSVIEGLVIVRPPTDPELDAWLAANPARYETPVRLDLEHAFASSERAGARQRAADFLQALAAGDSVDGLGDAFAPGTRHAGRSYAYLARTFGKSFVDAVGAAKVGQWLVIESDRGWHAVRVTKREGGEPPTREGLRAKLVRDWTTAEKKRRAAEKLAELVASYQIASGR
jgi:hypothetical protein